MGLDRELVDEAEARLREDLLAGMGWLHEGLKALEPPRRARGARAANLSWACTTGDDAISYTGGLCSRAVGAVETSDRLGTKTFPVDPERPFFVVGVFGRGRVRILDHRGHVLTGRTAEPLGFFLNDS